MILMTRPRPAILFVAVTALFLSLSGVPVAAQDGSVPARPTGLSTVATHESVTLTWNAPDDDSITHYKVLRRDPAVHAAYWFVTIEDDTGTAATRYTDDTVKPEKRYIYRIKAVNPHGVSTWSRHAKAITPAAPAPEPAPLTARFRRHAGQQQRYGRLHLPHRLQRRYQHQLQDLPGPLPGGDRRVSYQSQARKPS